MPERTLHFDNPREAQDITGANGKELARMAEAFGIEAVSRDLWLKLSGGTDAVEAAAAFVEALLQARTLGFPITIHTIAAAREAHANGHPEDFQRLISMRLEMAPGKPPVFPRTLGQAALLDAIQKHDITLCIGPAGTGKTWLAMAAAVSALRRGDVSRIILTRPAVEAGEALGFLPGDLQQKILPYLRPLYDALYAMLPQAEAMELAERGTIEIAPLAYMRGRTLNNAFIILDEAQNTTHEQMLMFLTRLGQGSRMVANGDLTQVDLPMRKGSGLAEAAHLLRRIPAIAVIEMTRQDIVRHPVVQRIIKAYGGE